MPARAQSMNSASLEPERLPPEWSYRKVAVPGQAVSCNVPRYIVRIDSAPGSRGATHGWQVRYDRKATRLFSDARYAQPGRMGTPQDSLRAAVEYLRSKWRGERMPALPREQQRKAQPTGMSGVRVVWRTRDGLRQCYVRVDDLKGQPLRSLYVGTVNTVKPSTLARKVNEALRLRREYLAAEGALSRLPRRRARTA